MSQFPHNPRICNKLRQLSRLKMTIQPYWLHQLSELWQNMEQWHWPICLLANLHHPPHLLGEDIVGWQDVIFHMGVGHCMTSLAT